MKNRQKTDALPIDGEKTGSTEIDGVFINIMENERFTALFACIFLSSGITLALLSLTVLEHSVSGILWYAFLAAAVIGLATLRWWIPVSGLGVIVFFTALRNLVQGTLPELIGFWNGFFNWLTSGAYFHEVYSRSSTAGLLMFLILFITQIVLYPVAKRPFLFPVLPVISTGIIIFSYAMFPANMSAAICICCIGAIVLLPGVYGRIIKKSGDTDKKTVSRMQLVAIPAAIIAVLLALLITPQDTRSWQSRTLVTLVEDFNYLLRGPFNRWPYVTPNFSMYDLGFQSETDRLGGPVTLSNEMILNVTSPVNVLLKGRVFDVYTGSNWEVGRPDGDFRFDSILWRRFRREAFGQDRPLGGSRTDELYRDLTKEIDLTVLHANSRYQSLFTAGRIRSLTFSSQLINPVGFYNMRSELYMHLRMPARHGIVLRTRVWDRSRANFDRLFLELEAIALNENDPRFDEVFDRYTALPESLPASVRELAAQITADDITPYGKVMSLVVWLNENNEYSLEPETVPVGVDFTAHFLETRIGYCTYFATALAIMARSEGIPARYVTGFALEEPEYGGRFMATGETAHAWTEMYFNGIGWVEIDPLNWNPAAPLNSSEPPELPETEPHIPDFTPETPPFNNEDNIDLSSTTKETPAENHFWLFIIVPLMILSFYFILRISIHSLLGRKNRQFLLKRILTRKSSNILCLEVYYNDILKQLALLYLQPLPGETLITFPGRADRRITLDKMDFSTVAKGIADYQFAGIKPDRSLLYKTWLYHQLLEKHLLESLGKWMYLIKRAIR